MHGKNMAAVFRACLEPFSTVWALELICLLEGAVQMSGYMIIIFFTGTEI